jgi:hypothetical protein
VRSKSAGSELSDTVTQEDDVFPTRERSGSAGADLFRDAVDEALRRGGSKTGVVCVWALGVEGRKGLRTLATANSASEESCLEVVRD